MQQLNFIYTADDLQTLTEIATDCKKELLKDRIYCQADSPRDQEITRKVRALDLLLNDMEYTARQEVQ